jgi:hypothetical protein
LFRQNPGWFVSGTQNWRVGTTTREAGQSPKSKYKNRTVKKGRGEAELITPSIEEIINREAQSSRIVTENTKIEELEIDNYTSVIARKILCRKSS